MTDYELMNEIRDRDHAEFEEVCQQEQAEAKEAYLQQQMQTPGTLLSDAMSLQFRSIRVVINAQQHLLMRLADQISNGRSIIRRQQTEISLLRQQIREMQQWKDSTHAFLVEPALRDERDTWEEKMREGMV